ncbi:MAG: hypothetical protein ACM3O7_02715 [Acidobacteriota bacterium]
MATCEPVDSRTPRYPLTSVALYDGATVVHFLLGASGMVIGYASAPLLAWGCGLLYLAFAFGEVFVLTPLAVCPSCVYTHIEGARCISGFNGLAHRLLGSRRRAAPHPRSQGLLCCNNLYLGAFLLPLVALVPALVVNPSIPLGIVYLSLLVLLVLRFTVIFPKVACRSCRARAHCSRAGAVGVHGPWSGTAPP